MCHRCRLGFLTTPQVFESKEKKRWARHLLDHRWSDYRLPLINILPPPSAPSTNVTKFLTIPKSFHLEQDMSSNDSFTVNNQRFSYKQFGCGIHIDVHTAICEGEQGRWGQKIFHPT